MSILCFETIKDECNNMKNNYCSLKNKVFKTSETSDRKRQKNSKKKQT